MKESCKHFDGCSAPICPVDPGSVENCAWFPDEDVCQLIVGVPDWIRRQRRIAKKGYGFKRGCFTVRMLDRKCRLPSNGVDPARGDPIDLEAAWIEKHPVLIATEAQRNARAKAAVLLHN